MPMPRLRELQLGFAEALAGEDAAERFAPWIRSEGLSGAERLRIYRHNGFATLVGALEAVFPVVRRLVGEACFAALTRSYVRAQPSASGDIHDYGGQLGAILAELPATAGYPYLGGVAALEWAYHQVFHTEPAPALDLETLRGLSPDRYPGLRFSLQPAARLVSSAFPVLRIWQVNQPDWAGDQRVDLGEGGGRVLVARRADGIELEPLSAGEGVWLAALAEGRSLAAALAEALAEEPGFDLGPALARRIAQGVLVAPPDIHPMVDQETSR